MYGRHLAGIGEVQDEEADTGYALNELRLMEVADDVKGNGVFDPPGTRPNTYADAGVFGGRYGLPGYIERERSYELSEVIDATTGRPVVYVPSGAVAIDSAAQVATIEGGMYDPPKPVMSAMRAHRLGQKNTWDTAQSSHAIKKKGPKAIAGLPLGMTYNSVAVLAGVAGLAGVVAYFALRGKK